MRLYHMTTLETVVCFILPHRRMRISEYKKLNDPFELRSVIFVWPNGEPFNAHVDHIEGSKGILCMGKHWHSPLMWAHYAGNHTGVCLGFDVPDDMAYKITYVPEPEKFTIDQAKPRGGVDAALMNKTLVAKFSGWHYEEEWRLSTELKERDPIDQRYYLPFGDNLALREVIVGAKCDYPIEAFGRLLGQSDPAVTIIKAKPDFNTFKMVPECTTHPFR